MQKSIRRVMATDNPKLMKSAKKILLSIPFQSNQEEESLWHDDDLRKARRMN
ncbi:MAG: hypothetical protein MUO63_10450 [Desulfobulbaceae bacterium]|nr:hypothetical protein [Desulfobulbaceae bacterium]